MFIRISNQPDKSETIKIETTTRSNNQNETAKDRELLALIKTTTNNGIRWEKKKILFHIDTLHIESFEFELYVTMHLPRQSIALLLTITQCVLHNVLRVRQPRNGSGF